MHAGRVSDRGGDLLPAEVDLAALIEGAHLDPHTILGPHQRADGTWLIRVWSPAARQVTLCRGGERRELDRIHPAGLFAAPCPPLADPASYTLSVIDAETGGEHRGHDPYAMWPTLGDVDLHLLGEGRHERLYDRLGAHPRIFQGVAGTAFAVWAPAARGVGVALGRNGWRGWHTPMRRLADSGVWELFLPGVETGVAYKFEILTDQGERLHKADPYARWAETPPRTASIVFASTYRWKDDAWMATRAGRLAVDGPMSIYEVHLGSWRRGDEQLTYRGLAPRLAAYVKDMGFTHVELMPIMEHPYEPSWGYQVTSYFAPTSRFGTPDDFRFFVDHLHQEGIGVILDWVPAHFPKDAWALGRFDGTALYEHLDPRQGEHPDWQTYVFNYGRAEVVNFLLGSALFWIDSFHADGLRLDAVASMLYLDYSRPAGQWIPNQYGGKENLEAIAFLRQLNETVERLYPDVALIAEESTAWPAVTRRAYLGGLGFRFKWNMGWMHDTLAYIQRDPIFRRFEHNRLTFGLTYAWSEHFILPLSHDEVVHGKGSLLGKMPGPLEKRFDALRALFAYMWAHPGKKLLFMGGELAQWREWSHETDLAWEALDNPAHRGVQQLVRDLNRIYARHPALWRGDPTPEGFSWIDCRDADSNVIAFRRRDPDSEDEVLCLCNFADAEWVGYRLGAPRLGLYREILNTDSEHYGGGNRGNRGQILAEPLPHHGLPCSIVVTLPPQTVLYVTPPPAPLTPPIAAALAGDATVGAIETTPAT